MKLFDWIVLAICLLIFASAAVAHEGHGSESAAVVAAPPASGTHDAQTWFTDTPLVDQNGQTLRFYSDVLKNRTGIIVGDVANKRWSRIRPDAPPAAIAQRLQLLTLPVAGR